MLLWLMKHLFLLREGVIHIICKLLENCIHMESKIGQLLIILATLNNPRKHGRPLTLDSDLENELLFRLDTLHSEFSFLTNGMIVHEALDIASTIHGWETPEIAHE